MQIRDIDLMIKILDNPIRYEGIQEDWHTSYQLYLLADMGYIDATVVKVGSDKEIYSNIKVSSVGKEYKICITQGRERGWKRRSWMRAVVQRCSGSIKNMKMHSTWITGS